MAVGFNVVSLVLVLVASVFLLLATISTPIVDTFNLAKTSHSTYGIFGACQGSLCSAATYPVVLSLVDDNTSNWLLQDSTRDNLAKIFVVAPIALGFSFITFFILVASVFTSNNVVLVALVGNILSFITTTLVAVIVVLVFYPNVAWTGWLLIGAAAATLISLVFMVLQLTINKDTRSDDVSLSEFVDKESKSDFATPFGTLDNNYKAFDAPASNPYNDSSSLISKGFESRASAQQSYGKQYNGLIRPVQQPQQPVPGKRNLSNSSVYNSNPQLANDFTQQNYHSSGSFYDANEGTAKPMTTYPSELLYPPTNVDPVYPRNHTSVFEHHPEVEGHKPFTELNDYDDEDIPLQNNLPAGRDPNDSDADSDFTSVSQRAINPRFRDYQSVPQQQYPNVQQFAPHFQQQQQQQQSPLMNQNYQQQPPQNYPSYNQTYTQPAAAQHRGPTISDAVLNNNPDFGVGGIGPSKRKVQNGFVPVANRYNNKPTPSSLMGRGGRSGPYGAI